jgi:hypothetical protein
VAAEFFADTQHFFGLNLPKQLLFHEPIHRIKAHGSVLCMLFTEPIRCPPKEKHPPELTDVIVTGIENVRVSCTWQSRRTGTPKKPLLNEVPNCLGDCLAFVLVVAPDFGVIRY